MGSRQELEARLDQLIESDADPGEITKVIVALEALGPDQPQAMPKEGDVNQLKLDAQALGISAQAPKQEVAPVSKLTITKAQLSNGVIRVLPPLKKEQIENSFSEIEGWNMIAMGVPDKAVGDPDHRIHVELKGEVVRAARGLAVVLAGGIQPDGTVLSPNGDSHFVKDGVCYEVQHLKQLNSFDRTEAVIERTVPCQGHLEYRNVGTQDKPKFVKTGREFSRCLHQWAVMFNAGYYVTCAKDLPNGGGSYMDIAVAAMMDRAGDEDGRKEAQAKFQEWGARAEEKREVRQEYGVVLAAEKAAQGLPAGSLLPAVPGVLDLPLPDGTKLGAACTALKGQFRVSFEVPLLGGRKTTQYVRANTLAELVSRMAPHVAVAKSAGQPLAIKAVEPVQ